MTGKKFEKDGHGRVIFDIRTNAEEISKPIKGQKLNLTILFISHDLRTVEYFCDRVAVMYLGEIVEQGLTTDIFSNPMHPYTKALLNSVPKIDFLNSEIQTIKGEIPSNSKLIKGCSFVSRCPMASKICKEQKPNIKTTNNEHLVKCFLSE